MDSHGSSSPEEVGMLYRAGDVMVRDVICVQSSMELRDLAKLFLDRGISGAPVVDPEGNLVGVISQRDLLFYNLTRDDELILDSDFYHRVRMEGRHVPAGFQIEDTNTGRVSDVMTPVVHAVSEKASVDSIARLMTRKHIHRVIVRRGRKVAGIISALDVLRIFGRPAVSASRGQAKGSAGSSRRSHVARPRKAAARR